MSELCNVDATEESSPPHMDCGGYNDDPSPDVAIDESLELDNIPF